LVDSATLAAYAPRACCTNGQYFHTSPTTTSGRMPEVGSMAIAIALAIWVIWAAFVTYVIYGRDKIG
jgi:hypothetical protein